MSDRVAYFLTGIAVGTYVGWCGVCAVLFCAFHVKERAEKSRAKDLERIAYFPAAKNEQVDELERMYQQ